MRIKELNIKLSNVIFFIPSVKKNDFRHQKNNRFLSIQIIFLFLTIYIYIQFKKL